MSNKKVGGILIFASILLLGVLIAYNFQLKLQSNAIGCNPNATCMKMNSLLTLTNIFIGIISAILSLAIISSPVWIMSIKPKLFTGYLNLSKFLCRYVRALREHSTVQKGVT